MEEERREHVTKMKKMEMEMEQVFEMKVKEKIQKLKDSEAEVLTQTMIKMKELYLVFQYVIFSLYSMNSICLFIFMNFIYFLLHFILEGTVV